MGQVGKEQEEQEKERRGTGQEEEEGGEGELNIQYTPTHLRCTIFHPMKISCTLLIVNLCKAIIVNDREESSVSSASAGGLFCLKC